MDIKILGAHSSESKNSRCISFLIDDTLSIDAGGLTSSLSMKEQKKLRAILLTHEHFDHIKDIPLLALNSFRMNKRIKIYSHPAVRSTIENHLLNGCVYPELQEIPVEKPTVNFYDIVPLREYKVGKYRVKAVPVKHHTNTMGYQVRNLDGKALFYTSDTGPGLYECWQHISCNVLLIETTLPNSYDEYARKTGHLTPNLLFDELTMLQQIQLKLPKIIVVHNDPLLENKIKKEIAEVAISLKIPIKVANEGMRFTI